MDEQSDETNNMVVPQLSSINSPKDAFIYNMKARFYMGLDFLTLFLFAFLVAIIAFLTNFALVYVLELIISPVLETYPAVASSFDWFQIGLASLSLFGAFLFVLLSAWSQMRYVYNIAFVSPLEVRSTND